jgi:hypothetical protein
MFFAATFLVNGVFTLIAPLIRKYYRTSLVLGIISLVGGNLLFIHGLREKRLLLAVIGRSLYGISYEFIPIILYAKQQSAIYFSLTLLGEFICCLLSTFFHYEQVLTISLWISLPIFICLVVMAL